MTIETFSWVPKIEPVGNVEFRLKSAKFGDGYQQVAADGINNKSQSWPLAFVGDEARIKAIVQFLDRHAGATPFYWTAPLGEPALYRCKGYQPTPMGAGLFTLAATFEQAFHP
ncbi:phage tail protein [Pseudomonas sp. SWRI153]|uniref:Phage tail protein n=1 Tax=Pseudomonas khorasanensis TaxID=2745508 RepID=A0A923F680_9PSED|nr:phage tail protein [Pseudomonas khorasanensis]MBV4486952.1 phage tail protein [Pseudomonas khorasanensis]